MLPFLNLCSNIQQTMNIMGFYVQKKSGITLPFKKTLLLLSRFNN